MQLANNWGAKKNKYQGVCLTCRRPVPVGKGLAVPFREEDYDKSEYEEDVFPICYKPMHILCYDKIKKEQSFETVSPNAGRNHRRFKHAGHS